MTTDRLLDAEQVAALIDMRVDYVWGMCRRGEIPHLRFGRTLRFRRAAVEEWLRQREHGSIRR